MKSNKWSDHVLVMDHEQLLIKDYKDSQAEKDVDPRFTFAVSDVRITPWILPVETKEVGFTVSEPDGKTVHHYAFSSTAELKRCLAHIPHKV